MNKYMQIADELSKQNLLTNNGGPFGAVVVKDGVVVGTGNNHVLRNNDPTAHGEMCLSATIWANIKTIYYGNTQLDAADIGFRDDFIYNYIDDICENEDHKENNDVLKLIPMDREETIKTFKEFKEKEDKTIY